VEIAFSQASFEALFSIGSITIFSQFSLREVKLVRKVAAGGQDSEQQGVVGGKQRRLETFWEWKRPDACVDNRQGPYRAQTHSTAWAS